MRPIRSARPSRRAAYPLLLLVACALLGVLRHGGRHGRPPAAAVPAQWTGRCVAVTDGDTIRVLQRGVEVKVRLGGVDCPERGQAFGAAARRFTSDAVFASTVTVHGQDRDRYGRTVGEVTMADGQSLNRALVAAGYAWWYRRYAPNDTALQALEAQARQGKRGLWADPQAVAPWEYRRQRRNHGAEGRQ